MKKGTRICAAGLLALTMALGAAPALGVLSPATALAEDVTVTVPGTEIKLGKQDWVIVDKKGVPTEVGNASSIGAIWGVRNFQPGDTLYLGEGTFDFLPNSGNYLNTDITIKGAGMGKTVLRGGVKLASNPAVAGYTVSISDLTVKYDGAVQLAVEAGIALDGTDATVSLSDVEISGFQYAVKAGDDAMRNSVSMSGVKLTNVWTAVSVNENKNTVGDVALADGSEYVYAVEDHTVDNKKDLYYSTFEDYRAGENAADANNKDGYFQNPGYGKGWEYHKVASIGNYNYSWINDAVARAKEGDTIAMCADGTLSLAQTVAANDVTLEGNGHVLTFKGTLTVRGNNFTLQNAKVKGGSTVSPLVEFVSNGYVGTLKDVALNNVAGSSSAFVAENGAAITVAGEFDLTPYMGDGSETPAIEIEGLYGSLNNRLTFAADATVKYNDVSWENIPFAMLTSDKNFVFPTVTSDSSAISVETVDVDKDKDGEFKTPEVDYKLVYVSAKAPEAQDVTVTRLYNPYTGEHLYTGDADEVQALVAMGWNDEGAKWVAPAESDTPVYRLYNPYNDEHHYTTDENEYAELAKIGWKQEGVKLYSAGEDGTPVYRLFNPYAERYTHLFTTDGNEAAELQQQGWQYEGVGFYGLK